MKSTNRNFTLCVFLLASLYLCVIACKDDDKPKLLPEVTTTEVTEITTSTAVSGGSVTSNGNDELTAAGICWSNTNATPTITDSKTEITTVDEAFTGKMESLSSGSTYYVRAYATNSVGTGYGDALMFMTGNAAPVATNVAISGIAEVNKVLRGSYTYTDANNDAEGGTVLQWYRANDGSGTGEVPITDATTATYILQDTDEFKFIRFGVTPKSSIGNQTGNEVKSVYFGPIAVRTTITFTYNGGEVTYGIITSPITGRKWLDRNLGAKNTPSSQDDFENFGDLFQWGRGSDGHQLVNRTGSSAADMSAANGVTTTLSINDNPGHNLYIASGTTLPRDWRTPQNDLLWQGANGKNNPCPAGWLIPSEIEWDAENLSALDAAFVQLKITSPGFARGLQGTFSGTGSYWSSTPTKLNSTTNTSVSYNFRNPAITNPKSSSERARGYLCRCIKSIN